MPPSKHVGAYHFKTCRSMIRPCMISPTRRAAHPRDPRHRADSPFKVSTLGARTKDWGRVSLRTQGPLTRGHRMTGPLNQEPHRLVECATRGSLRVALSCKDTASQTLRPQGARISGSTYAPHTRLSRLLMPLAHLPFAYASSASSFRSRL